MTWLELPARVRSSRSDSLLPGSTGVPPDVLCSSRSDGMSVAGGFNPRTGSKRNRRRGATGGHVGDDCRGDPDLSPRRCRDAKFISNRTGGCNPRLPLCRSLRDERQVQSELRRSQDFRLEPLTIRLLGNPQHKGANYGKDHRDGHKEAPHS